MPEKTVEERLDALEAEVFPKDGEEKKEGDQGAVPPKDEEDSEETG